MQCACTSSPFYTYKRTPSLTPGTPPFHHDELDHPPHPLLLDCSLFVLPEAAGGTGANGYFNILDGATGGFFRDGLFPPNHPYLTERRVLVRPGSAAQAAALIQKAINKAVWQAPWYSVRAGSSLTCGGAAVGAGP